MSTLIWQQKCVDQELAPSFLMAMTLAAPVLEVPVQKPSHLLTLIFSATYWFAEHCCG